jgi:hypothetical protein
MAKSASSRGASRDRHGRGIRRPLLSNLFRFGDTRNASFEQIVKATCEFLRAAWPADLAELNWRIVDAPPLREGSEQVPRWGIRQETMTVIIYRLPIERLGHHRKTDPVHERMHIEEYVFTAAAKLVGKEPWELITGR